MMDALVFPYSGENSERYKDTYPFLSHQSTEERQS